MPLKIKSHCLFEKNARHQQDIIKCGVPNNEIASQSLEEFMTTNLCNRNKKEDKNKLENLVRSQLQSS